MKNNEENKNKILAKNSVQIELADLAPTLVRIRAAMHNGKTVNDGFKMPPPQYHDQFLENLMQNLDKNAHENLAIKFPKADNFKTPPQYFDNLADRILAREKSTIPPTKLTVSRNFGWAKWASAAAVLVGLSVVFLKNNANPSLNNPTVVVEIPKMPPPSIDAQNPPSTPILKQNETKNVENGGLVAGNVESFPQKDVVLNVPTVEKPALETPKAVENTLAKVNVSAELDKIFDELEGESTDLLDVLNLTDEELDIIAIESEGIF